MRTGCFLNGCCFGTPTSLPWGVTFPAGSAAWAQQFLTGETGLFGLAGAVKPVHPTELYEIVAALVFGGLAIWLTLRGRQGDARPRTASGVPFLTFALGFTLFRLADDFLRAKLPTYALPAWFYPLLYAAISVAVAGLIVWRSTAGRHEIADAKGGENVVYR